MRSRVAGRKAGTASSVAVVTDHKPKGSQMSIWRAIEHLRETEFHTWELCEWSVESRGIGVRITPAMLNEMDERTARAIFRTAQQLQERLPRLREERDFIRAFNQRWKVLGYEKRFGKLLWAQGVAAEMTRVTRAGVAELAGARD
jgi:hypothetical protein